MTAPGPSVLLIEDEPQMRRFIRASLGSRGYRLIEAATAQEAVLLASSHAPELVLLDLGLPDSDGIDLTRKLREWCRTPIIVLSARGREEDKVAALDAGADDKRTKERVLSDQNTTVLDRGCNNKAIRRVGVHLCRLRT